MSIQPIFIILVDISGYTNFIKLHKMSLLHAEKIIGDLMESILDQVKAPVVAHEILGDAISLYAVDEGTPGMADQIYSQLQQYFDAFRRREAYLIRECGFCICDACNTVGKLKLKAILHAGPAAFTKVREIQKISGEDIIIAHRLLKNSIASKEYICMTSSFLDKCESLNRADLDIHAENCEGIGSIKVAVENFDEEALVPVNVSTWQKLKHFMKMEGYAIARLFGKAKLEFKNLPS